MGRRPPERAERAAARPRRRPPLEGPALTTPAPLKSLTAPGHRKRLLAAGALAVVLVVWLRRKRSAAAADGVTGSLSTDAGAAAAGAGAPYATDGSLPLPADTTGYGTGGYDTTWLSASLEGLSSGLSDVQTRQAQTDVWAQSAFDAAAQATQRANDVGAASAKAPSWLTSPPSWYSTPSSGAGDPNPTPAPAVPGNAKATAAGFWWGGLFVRKAAQLVTFERSHGNTGFDLTLWASQHPDAARLIGITPPPPAPARKLQVEAPPLATLAAVLAPVSSSPTPAYVAPYVAPPPVQTVSYGTSTQEVATQNIPQAAITAAKAGKVLAV